jgi:DNA-binding MarR family transcriptional regulator
VSRERGGEVIRSPRGDAVTALIDEVFLLNNALLRAGDRLAGTVGLTSASWRVLGRLDDGPATVAELARVHSLRRQSVQGVVDRLRGIGLVATDPNPRDGRAPLVRLTDSGYAILRRLQPDQARWADELGSGLDPEQLAAALATLRRIRAEVNETV